MLGLREATSSVCLARSRQGNRGGKGCVWPASSIEVKQVCAQKKVQPSISSCRGDYIKFQLVCDIMAVTIIQG